jgi:hypothetical protein
MFRSEQRPLAEQHAVSTEESLEPEPQENAVAGDSTAGFGVVVSDTGLEFRRKLSEAEFRLLWRVMWRLGSKAKDWIKLASGDWANEVDKRLGKGSSERLCREEPDGERPQRREAMAITTQSVGPRGRG